MPRPPSRFREFVGHKAVVDRLLRQLVGAMTRGEPLLHTLVLGPSGVGKTLLARTLAQQYGTSLAKAMGYFTRRQLAGTLSTLRASDFLFIDEAHRLGSLEQELLMEAIEQLSVPDFREEKKAAAAKGRVTIPPWTLVLATDQPGRLVDALVKRMVIQIELDFYPADELKEIVEVMATDLNLLLSPQAARQLALMSGGLPRRAEHHLKKLRLHFPDSEDRQLGAAEVREYREAFEIDEEGIGPLERRYLAELGHFGAASLESLALTLGTDPAFLRRHVEAQLVKRRLVTICAGGRRLTQAGQRWLREAADPEIERGEGNHHAGQNRAAAH